MKVSKSRIRQLINESIRNILKEDEIKVDSEIRRVDKQTSKGSYSKNSYKSNQKNVDTKEEHREINKMGTFENGVHYYYEFVKHFDPRLVRSNKAFDSSKHIAIGKTKKKGYNSVGITFHHGNKKPHYTVGGKGKQVSLLKFLVEFAKLGIGIRSLLRVIKEIDTEVDTTELENEAIKIK
tara:strand:- start:2894 stop:3433 length:540 start_codon:yes stop_codon:yes gene_type:complete